MRKQGMYTQNRNQLIKVAFLPIII